MAHDEARLRHLEARQVVGVAQGAISVDHQHAVIDFVHHAQQQTGLERAVARDHGTALEAVADPLFVRCPHGWLLLLNDGSSVGPGACSDQWSATTGFVIHYPNQGKKAVDVRNYRWRWRMAVSVLRVVMTSGSSITSIRVPVSQASARNSAGSNPAVSVTRSAA